jgi:hypothetical protein
MQLSDLPPLVDLRPDTPLMANQVALYIGTSEHALDRWRRAEPVEGPPFLRLGNGPKARVRYLAGDVLKWMQGQRVDPSADPSTEVNTPAAA